MSELGLLCRLHALGKAIVRYIYKLDRSDP